MAITLKFDANQEFQHDAIQAVVDVFDGVPPLPLDQTLSFEAVPNLPPGAALDERLLAENVAAIQERNGIPQQQLLAVLEADSGRVLSVAGADTWSYPSFTVEMETGTGKTYVYLRTMHELYQRYGWRKYVIVVPSVAIYEGVIKNLAITRSHFATLYGNTRPEVIAYDGARLSALRHFCTTTSLCVMVMTLASFNSANNVIFRASEALPGERLPFQYIQDTRPILILDEPQNMGSDRAKEALRTLKPLFALRYSATHRETPNLVYRLTPFDAYYLRLVKMVEVDAVLERQNPNLPGLALAEIGQRSGRWVATVQTRVNDHGTTREAPVTLYQNDDLGRRTLREEHSAGYIVENINAAEGYVEFVNGERLHLNESLQPTRPAIFRAQIEATVQTHMQRQQELLDQGVKVLSLFFIDRVANYVDDDGIIRKLFDEIYEQEKSKHPRFAQWSASQVREAYFAKRKVKGSDEEEAFDAGDRRADERDAQQRAYQTIMQDKERLLSLEEPIAFIFAHSALKEGWDNPNVFQICTLNQTRSELKKRQEIGRGLRLCVNQEGERVHDEAVNVLTVVANESYSDFCTDLQSEYVEAGQAATPPPSRRGTGEAKRNEALFQDPCFRDFWAHLMQRARYTIHIDTDEVVARALERMSNDRKEFYELQPVIVREKGLFVMTAFEIALLKAEKGRASLQIEARSTDGNSTSWERTVKARDALDRLCDDERLGDYQVKEISEGDLGPQLLFTNGQRLDLYRPIRFESEAGQSHTERTRLSPGAAYPVPNLVDRAARETGLTRQTVFRVFAGLSETRKPMILRNPEGFVGWFIGHLRNTLADHLVENLQYELCPDREAPPIETFFPQVRKHSQKRLVPGGEPGLYDQVQVDSDVEKRFVEQRVQGDDRVICYFKFPDKFEVCLPRLVGNYNPDWGILRYDDDGRTVLQLVRETKGTTDPSRLRFDHERRKIRAATDYFRLVASDYRVVDDTTVDWWEPEPEQGEMV